MFYKNSATVECYQYNFRTGAGPTSGSSTAIANLTSWMINTAGTFLIYAKSAAGSIYWRTISNCTLGSEQSLSLSGSTGVVAFHQPDDGSFVAVVDNAKIYKLAVSASGFSVSGSKAISYGSDSSSLTADGSYLVYTSFTGIDALEMSTLTNRGVVYGSAVHKMIAVSSSKIVTMRTGVTHLGVTLSSGTPVLGAAVDYGTTDFVGGIAYPPSRLFYYTGNNSDGEIDLHTVTGTNPFATITAIPIGISPDALAYLSGYTAR